MSHAARKVTAAYEHYIIQDGAEMAGDPLFRLGYPWTRTLKRSQEPPQIRKRSPKVERNKHLIPGPERNSLFCFPENLSRCFPRRCFVYS